MKQEILRGGHAGIGGEHHGLPCPALCADHEHRGRSRPTPARKPQTARAHSSPAEPATDSRRASRACGRCSAVCGPLGHRPGPVDGLYGPLTEAAVERLQRDSGLVGRRNRRTADPSRAERRERRRSPRARATDSPEARRRCVTSSDGCVPSASGRDRLTAGTAPVRRLRSSASSARPDNPPAACCRLRRRWPSRAPTATSRPIVQATRAAATSPASEAGVRRAGRRPPARMTGPVELTAAGRPEDPTRAGHDLAAAGDRAEGTDGAESTSPRAVGGAGARPGGNWRPACGLAHGKRVAGRSQAAWRAARYGPGPMPNGGRTRRSRPLGQRSRRARSRAAGATASLRSAM